MTPTIADAPFPKQPFLYDYGTTFHSSKTRSFVLNKLQAYHSPKTAQIRKTTANLGKDGLAELWRSALFRDALKEVVAELDRAVSVVEETETQIKRLAGRGAISDFHAEQLLRVLDYRL